MIPKQQITGLILAGGRGIRMGTVDKGLLPIHGEAMILHVLRRLKPQVGTLIINANQNLSAYADFGAPTCPDEISGYAGPLAGLHAGLTHCRTPYLVCVPCDTPGLPTDLVARLANALTETNAELATVVTSTLTTAVKDNGTYRQLQPVFSLMRVTVLPDLVQFLENGGRKVETWFSNLNTVEVTFENASAFRNLNTLPELHEFERNET